MFLRNKIYRNAVCRKRPAEKRFVEKQISQIWLAKYKFFKRELAKNGSAKKGSPKKWFAESLPTQKWLGKNCLQKSGIQVEDGSPKIGEPYFLHIWSFLTYWLFMINLGAPS